jgi:hypothetical protein
MPKYIFFIYLFLLTVSAKAEPDCGPAFSLGVEPALSMMDIFRKVSPDLCIRLSPGESRVINVEAFMSPTGTESKYKLSRLSETDYLAEIRLEFFRDTDFDGDSRSDRELNRNMKRKVDACFHLFRDSFRGPDGKKLEIRLSRAPEIPLERIPVGGRVVRTHSHKYSSSVNCPTMIHEILHLMGLVDEYKEFSEGYADDPTTGIKRRVSDGSGKNAYDCRTYGPPTSVMYDQWAAITRASDWDKYEVTTCECLPKHNCKDLEKLAQGDMCPEGTIERSETIFLTRGEPIRLVDERRFILPGTKPKKIGGQSKEVSSILMPAHFRSITEPGCRDVNARYYACARNAYRYSQSTGFLMGGGCYETPDYCQSGDMDWLQ